MDNYSAVYRRLEKIKATIEQLDLENKNLRKRLKAKTDPLQDEINKLKAYVEGYEQQAAARERVLQSISNEYLKLPSQELQTLGSSSETERTEQGDQTGVVAEASR